MFGRLEKIARYVVGFCSAFLLLFCLLLSLFISFTDESLEILNDSAVFTLFEIFLVTILIVALNKYIVKIYEKYIWLERAHLLLTVIFAGVVGFVVLKGMNQSPQSDALAIYSIAKSFAADDYSAYTSSGSYLALFPFQTSFVFVMEMIMRITGKVGYLLFQYMNIVYLILIVVSGYGIVKCQDNSKKAVFPYLVLSSTCAPLYLYMPNIYGDIPHLALSIFSLWMLAICAKRNERGIVIGTAILGIGAVTLAVMYKGNTWIYIVAYLLCIVVAQFKKKSLRMIIVTIALLVVVGSIPNVPDYIYEKKTGRTCGTGIPMIAVITMGLQETDGACGRWNGFHSDLFVETGYDYDATKEKSLIEFNACVENFLNNPSYAAYFFGNKLAIQWAEQEYSSFYSLTFGDEEKKSSWANEVLYGDAHSVLLEIMDIHQSIVYFYAIVFVVYIFFKKTQLRFSNMIILVTFIGGFLFSIIWEAGARITFPYFVFLIPIASQGIAYIEDLISKRSQNDTDFKKAKSITR